MRFTPPAAGRLAGGIAALLALAAAPAWAETFEAYDATLAEADGAGLTDAASVDTGTPIQVRLARGRLDATVKETHPDEEL